MAIFHKKFIVYPADALKNDLAKDISEPLLKQFLISKNLRLALHEAITNALIHGCLNDMGKVEIEISENEKNLTIKVSDNGNGFDFTKALLNTKPYKGLALIKVNTDDFFFENNGKTLNLIFTLSNKI